MFLVVEGAGELNMYCVSVNYLTFRLHLLTFLKPFPHLR